MTKLQESMGILSTIILLIIVILGGIMVVLYRKIKRLKFSVN